MNPRNEINRKGAFERHLMRIPESGCWLWIGSLEKGGYGVFHLHGCYRPGVRAHRAAWELYKGTIPRELNVLHRCDVRCCVNPNHLFLGTHADNTRDMIAKGRGIFPGGIPGSGNGRAKLTEAKVQLILARAYEPRSRLAAEFGVAPTCISDIILRKTWKHVHEISREV